MGKTKKHENTFINKGLSIATFDHQIIFLPGSALSMNNQCFCWCFLCSCLKTLSLAPSLPLQALLLLLELVHLCPLRAEFRIGKAYPAEVSSSIYIYIILVQERVPVRGGCHTCFLIAKSRGSTAREPPAQLPRRSGLLYHIHPHSAWQNLIQIMSDSFRFCLRMLSLLTFCRAKYCRVILHMCFAIQPHCSEQLGARHRKRKLRPCQLDETLLDSRLSQMSKLATFRERLTLLNSNLFTVHAKKISDKCNERMSSSDFEQRSCLGELGEVQGKIPPDARQCHAAGQGPELVLIGQ